MPIPAVRRRITCHRARHRRCRHVPQVPLLLPHAVLVLALLQLVLLHLAPHLLLLRLVAVEGAAEDVALARRPTGRPDPSSNCVPPTGTDGPARCRPSSAS